MLYTPIEAYNSIREVLLRRTDLRFKDWKTVENLNALDDYFDNNPYMGFCYVASHAFTFLVPEATLHRHKHKFHYWNEIDGEILDLTKEQFKYEFPYSEGKRVPRKSKPTERVQEILKEL